MLGKDTNGVPSSCALRNSEALLYLSDYRQFRIWQSTTIPILAAPQLQSVVCFADIDI